MVLALQSGDVQVVQQLSYIDAQGIRNAPGIALIQADAADHRQLCMRTDTKPFDDKRVRQAVALCFDRPTMVRGLLGGLADVANDHPIAPIYPEKIEIPQRQANLQQAKQLLTAAGYPQGFTIDLYTHQYLELPQFAALTQQMLAPAGIKVNLKVEPTNLYYNHWTEVSFGLTDWTSRPVAAQILAQSFRSTAEWNAAHWKNPQFDEMLAKFEAEPDVTSPKQDRQRHSHPSQRRGPRRHRLFQQEPPRLPRHGEEPDRQHVQLPGPHPGLGRSLTCCASSAAGCFCSPSRWRWPRC